VVGSTSLAATLDADDWRDLVGAYLDDAAKAIGQYGGHVAKKLGDGPMRRRRMTRNARLAQAWRSFARSKT
jgi:class 3 adenylate cyclase